MSVAPPPARDSTSNATDAGLLAALSLIFALAPFAIRVLDLIGRYLLLALIGDVPTALAPFNTFQFVSAVTTALTSLVLSPLAVILGVLAMRHPDATEPQLRRALVGLLVGAFGVILIVIGLLVIVLS